MTHVFATNAKMLHKKHVELNIPSKLLALFTLNFKMFFSKSLFKRVFEGVYTCVSQKLFSTSTEKTHSSQPPAEKGDALPCSAVVLSVRFRTLSHFLKKPMFSLKLICLHVRKIYLLSQALIIFKFPVFYNKELYHSR